MNKMMSSRVSVAVALACACVVLCGAKPKSFKHSSAEDFSYAQGQADRAAGLLVGGEDTAEVKLAPQVEVIWKDGDAKGGGEWVQAVQPWGKDAALVAADGKLVLVSKTGVKDVLVLSGEEAEPKPAEKENVEGKGGAGVVGGGMVQSLHVAKGMGDQKVLVGVGGETARVLEVEVSTGASKQIGILDGAQYVWALVSNAEGTKAYAATGPEGYVYEVDLASGKVSGVVVDVPQANVTSMAMDKEGRLVFGTDEDGVVYRAKPGGVMTIVKAEVDESDTLDPKVLRKGNDNVVGAGGEIRALFDADEEEIVSVICVGDEVWVTATTAGGDFSGGMDRDLGISIGGDGEGRIMLPDVGEDEGSAGADGKSADAAGATQDGDVAPPAGDKPTGDGDKSDSPVASDDSEDDEPDGSGDHGSTSGGEGPSAVYRIDAAGFVKEVYRGEQTLYAAGLWSGRSAFGKETFVMGGDEGRVLLMNKEDGRHATMTRSEGLDITAIGAAADGARDGEGGVWMGVSNPAGLLYMKPVQETKGELVSEPLDAEQVVRLGQVRIDVQGVKQMGKTLSVHTRTGNVQNEDAPGWSDWTEAKDMKRGLAGWAGASDSASGRYVQYKVVFNQPAEEAGVVLRGIELVYQQANAAPVISTLAAEESTDEAIKPAASVRTLTWEATDPNEDDLQYAVMIRRMDDAGSSADVPWVVIKDKLTETTYTWDTRSVADGAYEVKVVADDGLSDPSALTGERVLRGVLVDNTAPVVELGVPEKTQAGVSVKISAKDDVSPLSKIDYAINSAEDWKPLAVSDRICDSLSESALLVLPVRKDAVSVTVRVTDQMGNEGVKHLLLPGGM